MKTTSATTCICDQEITPQMVREGHVMSRGDVLVCRGCAEGRKRLARAGGGAGRSSGPSSRPATRGAGRSGIPSRPTGGGAALPGASGRGTEWDTAASQRFDGGVVYASFFRRLAAHVIDSLILNVAVFGGGLAFGIGAGLMGAMEPTTISIVGGVIGAVLPIGYCLWFWMKTGATPGKHWLGVRIVSASSGPMTAGQSLVRYFGYVLSTLVFGLGYLWMLWDDEGRCWHDILAGTRVIRIL